MNPCTDARRTETCVAPRHIDASRYFYFIFSQRAAWGGGWGRGGALPDFLFRFLFPVQQTTSGIGYRVTSRARSLRNLLVSGNECGRVFPAGVGPGSPSRDAANWLPSRFSLSVETRRRYGWLRMMVFPGARLFPSPNLGPFGRVAARERQGALSRRAW